MELTQKQLNTLTHLIDTLNKLIIEVTTQPTQPPLPKPEIEFSVDTRVITKAMRTVPTRLQNTSGVVVRVEGEKSRWVRLDRHSGQRLFFTNELTLEVPDAPTQETPAATYEIGTRVIVNENHGMVVGVTAELDETNYMDVTYGIKFDNNEAIQTHASCQVFKDADYAPTQETPTAQPDPAAEQAAGDTPRHGPKCHCFPCTYG